MPTPRLGPTEDAWFAGLRCHPTEVQGPCGGGAGHAILGASADTAHGALVGRPHGYLVIVSHAPVICQFTRPLAVQVLRRNLLLPVGYQVRRRRAAIEKREWHFADALPTKVPLDPTLSQGSLFRGWLDRRAWGGQQDRKECSQTKQISITASQSSCPWIASRRHLHGGLPCLLVG